MDPFGMSVLASVVANALTTFVSYLGREGAHYIEKRSIEDVISRDAQLATILQEASTHFAKSIDVLPAEMADQVREFLTSADVDAILRQFYATRLAAESGALQAIREEFSSSFALRFGEDSGKLLGAATTLFDAMLDACERALSVAIDKGILSAHEAKSAARTRLILDELAAIKARIRLLAEDKKLCVPDINGFESTLRCQIAARHATIVPPHIDVQRRIPIDDLYVPSMFSLARNTHGHSQAQQEIELSQVLRFMYRVVVLGNPGSGKSTLAHKICHDFAAKHETIRLGERKVTPILLSLREYSRDHKDKGFSIVQLIETVCNTTYQVSPPPKAIEYLLRSGRLLVIFDGLDEPLDTSHRQKMSRDVESFCNLFPGTPVLVTSRQVGYEQAPLDEQQFDTLRIEPFSDEQIHEYVTKWFAADYELGPSQQKEKATAFLRESNSVPDLRTNPLMLALMCTIYRGENYIPRNRPDVYEKCALMLFEKWDRSRGLNPPLPFEALVRPAMMHLAHWVFSREALQGGVTETALIDECTTYLSQRRYEDADEARHAASEFIEFCRGRAWVFTDTGTTPEGERLYQFTHRTFLEYFTAVHLVRTNPTPEQLGLALIPRVAAREWDVIAQLAFQLQNKQVEGAGDHLIKNVINTAKAESDIVRQSNLISFVARALEFLVPSPSVTRDIVTATLDHCFSVVAGRAAPAPREERLSWSQLSSETIGSLLSCAEENKLPVARQTDTHLQRLINSPEKGEALFGARMAVNLSSFLLRRRARQEREFEPGLRDYWEDVGKRVIQATTERVRQLSKGDLSMCLDAVFADCVPITDLINWHGVQSLFYPSDRLFWFANPPIVPLVTFSIIEMRREGEEMRQLCAAWARRFAEASALVAEMRPPWLSAWQAKNVQRWYERVWHSRRKGTTQPRSDIEPGLAFFAFIAASVWEELHAHSGQTAEPSRYEYFRRIVREVPFLKIAFLVRSGNATPAQLTAALANSGFSEAQNALVHGWASGSLSLVARKGPGKGGRRKRREAGPERNG